MAQREATGDDSTGLSSNFLRDGSDPVRGILGDRLHLIRPGSHPFALPDSILAPVTISDLPCSWAGPGPATQSAQASEPSPASAAATKWACTSRWSIGHSRLWQLDRSNDGIALFQTIGDLSKGPITDSSLNP